MDRRQAMLEAGRALFIQHGYKRTTLEAIIAIAGGSRETIYTQFGGKQGLFGAIISDVGKRLASSLTDLDGLELPPREGLTQMGGKLMELWSSKEIQAIHRVVLSEGLDAPEIMEAWYSGGPKLALLSITDYLAVQKRAGRLQLDDPGIAAKQFVWLLMGEAAFRTMSGSVDPFDHAAAVDRTVSLMLRAYQPPLDNRSP